MKNSTNIFINKLDERGYNYKIETKYEAIDEISVFCPVKNSRCSLETVELHCAVYDHWITISTTVAQISKNNSDEIVKVLNELNSWYNFVTYSISENNRIYARISFEFNDCCVGDICLHAIYRIRSGIQEELWPSISKYI